MIVLEPVSKRIYKGPQPVFNLGGFSFNTDLKARRLVRAKIRQNIVVIPDKDQPKFFILYII